MRVPNFNPPVIAHRGASAYAPENTLAAFTKAAQLGIKWIEFDVMEAADGEAIIFHDELLDRTTNAQGDISHYSYPYLCRLDAGSWFDLRFAGEPIPSLTAVIEFLKNTKLSANVEIKALPGREERLVKKVVKMIADSGLRGILFSSFSIDALHYLRQYSPEGWIGLLLHEWEHDWERLCDSLNCVSVHVNHEIMTAAKARQIKEMDKKLLCYTVNDSDRAEELFSWGVDAVFSDTPDKILHGKDEEASL